MKTTLMATLFALSAAVISAGSAQALGVGVRADVDAAVGVRTGKTEANTEAEATARGTDTSTATQATTRTTLSAEAKEEARNDGRDDERDDTEDNDGERNDGRGNATSTSARAKGQLTAEEHRSSVASFVRSLLAVANREGGIGGEVRVIARSQQDSASTSANAIAKVEERGSLRAVLFGSDYQSLGELRSEMATTSANIIRLRNLLAKTTNDSDKAELSAQIEVLEDSQVKIDAFITAHEDSFSFFGWFAKLFTK